MSDTDMHCEVSFLSFLWPNNIAPLSLHILFIHLGIKAHFDHLYLLLLYISYFSIVVIKYHDQDSLRKKGFIWAYGSKRLRVHNDRETW